eukprot:CAMPEP_0183784864 /NCGR_PEP_ID=MMETSP0739-20130205/66210_1 /TAXON_ID=385413 /ORGANISM="Thalassiosira miniscula, Strain CCMP1093" /LENGTH=379 /DNA_ID=CAMNT_0026028855 /DNA_START=343 /DNA_END=1483 /DNA_ORIENTATION=-
MQCTKKKNDVKTKNLLSYSWMDIGLPSYVDPTNENECLVHPVILSGKPDFDDSLSVLERIFQLGIDAMQQCNNQQNMQQKRSSKENQPTILLVGRSASGKSTLLRIFSGIESPMEGNVSINHGIIKKNANAQKKNEVKTKNLLSYLWMNIGLPLYEDSINEKQCLVHPVILSGKPDFDDSLSVLERIVQLGIDAMQQCNNQQNMQQKRSSKENQPTEEATTKVIQTLAQDFASLLTLTREQCEEVPSKLSPSGQYLFALACGCIVSVAPSVASMLDNNDIHSKGNSSDKDNHNTNDTTNDILPDSVSVHSGIHYPILLLDELFDTEHSSIVQLCGEGMLNLIRRGGVVISATHKPEFFSNVAKRRVTLSGGKVLKDELY